MDKTYYKSQRITPRDLCKTPPFASRYCGMSGENFNPQNTQCIPVVKIFAFLELESRYSGKHFSKVSPHIETLTQNWAVSHCLLLWIRFQHQTLHHARIQEVCPLIQVPE